jgi:hypothetical protein
MINGTSVKKFTSFNLQRQTREYLLKGKDQYS